MEQCCICFDNKKLVNIGECQHEFCSKCIEKWKESSNNCPLCRSNINYNNRITIGNLNGLTVTPEKYLSQDKISNCLNHNLIINKPFGVTIYCQDCNKTHCFNWIN